MTSQASEAVQLFLDGVALHKAARFDEAAAHYDRVLEAHPRHADALHLRGVIDHQRNDHAAAIQRIRQAIALNGGTAAYFSNLGIAYRSLGRSAEAIAALDRSLELQADSPGVLYNLGNALKDSARFSDAVRAYRAGLDLDPQNADAWSGLGDALRRLGDFDQSCCCHERARMLNPRSAEREYDFGLTLKDADRPAEAAQAFLRAAALRPAFLDAHVSLGNVYEDLGLFDRAIVAYDRALQVDLRSTSAHFNRALTRLRKGDLADGWKEYESRWRHNGKSRIFAEPQWDGLSLAGKTLLIYGEQGVGDEVMFASCFQEVIARAQHCLIECEPRLVRLFARSFPSATVFPRIAEIDPHAVPHLPNWDVQIAAGSLPARVRSDWDSFPKHGGYLVPDREAVQRWRDRFETLGAGLVVGISWRGGKDPAIRRRRSTALRQWKPLFEVNGIAFVNLQYGDCREEIENCPRELGVTIHTWDDADPVGDLDGFAAQVAACDLVISVDNATVHFAGALNVPVWTLLPFSCDWRWFADREASPWYPSMRLARQMGAPKPEENAWEQVFERVAAALVRMAGAVADNENLRGHRAHRNARPAEAIAHYQRALALRPDHAEAVNNLGVVCEENGRTDMAAEAYRRAVAANSRFGMAWFNLGNSFREQNRLEEAVDAYRRARGLMSGDVETAVNLSIALKELRRLDEASQLLNEVVEASPELAEGAFNRSLLSLLQGDLERGWDEYEARLKIGPNLRALPPNRWDGAPLKGRSILILAEQGIGDQVMFASCVPDVIAEADRAFIECDPRLVPLFERSFPKITAIAKPKDSVALPRVEGCGVVEFIGSLPRFVRRTPIEFPSRPGYLRPDPQAVARWRSNLARLGGALKVGISWRGGKDAETRRKRSIPLEMWSPLLEVPGTRFVSLQYGATQDEVTQVSARLGVAIENGADCDPLVNIDDFAAKIAGLDLILSVDNSTVHLAAAIGCPVWTLLPFSCDWRWMLEGEQTPWYPTMRLLRCRTTDGWSELLQRAARLLTAATFSRETLSLKSAAAL